MLTKEADFWTSGRIKNLIQERFSVTYSKRQVQRLLRLMGMYCYKPQPRDHRQRPDHAHQLSQRLQAVADVLGMGSKDLSQMAIGFADESTFQTYGNAARLWSFHKGRIRAANTNRTRQNCFGFYAIRGQSLLVPIGVGNEQTFLAMLDKIKASHIAYQGIILIWDNHPAHVSSAIESKAHKLGIYLVNLPTYSPNLNPIERLWKVIKRRLCEVDLIANGAVLNQLIEDAFKEASVGFSFAKKWIKDFWNVIFWKAPILNSV
ncbi:hypothetical protein FHK02_6078 [Spirosoma sp. LMG 31448]|nr:hypothetical protein [Spirosoma utsteinense]